MRIGSSLVFVVISFCVIVSVVSRLNAGEQESDWNELTAEFYDGEDFPVQETITEPRGQLDNGLDDPLIDELLEEDEQDLGAEEIFKGIYLIALPPTPDFEYDIPLLKSQQALKIMRDSLSVLYDKSPYLRKKMEELTQSGEVAIIYNPDFPEWTRGDIKLAAFIPNFFNLDGTDSRKSFVAILGRYLIRHSTVEIAAEGVTHELVGHGHQHLSGTLDKLRGLNAECEASLYEMMAFQDLGANMETEHISRFIQELTEHNCSYFRQYIRENKPEYDSLWSQVILDVPKLVAIFSEYVEEDL